MSASSPPPPAAVIVGDVGSEVAFHVGDEAMLEAVVAGTEGWHWTAVSLDPDATTRRLGVPAVPRLGFPAGEDAQAAREARLAQVLAFGDGAPVPAGDPAGEVLAALRGARGLLVAGGGNLSSTWPEHVYERVALMALARGAGLHVAVTGQTLGPELEGREWELLAWALRGAALVGAREPASQRLAFELGVPPDRVALQLDDAMFLPGGTVPPVPEPFVAVTVNELGDPATEDRVLAGLADGLAAVPAPIVLVPHVGALSGPPSADVRVAEALRHRLAARGVEAVAVGLLAPADVAALTRRAELVVSTRYHPLVFGLGAAAPSLALPLDEYTRTKMRGALGFAGLEEWSLPVDAAADGLLADAVTELWSRRAEIRAHLEPLLPGWRSSSAAHAARTLGALDGRVLPGEEPAPPGAAPTPVGAWAVAARAVERVRRRAEGEKRGFEAEIAERARQFDEVERYALSLHSTLEETRVHVRGLQAALDQPEVADQAPARRRLRRARPPTVTASPAAAPPPELLLTDLRHNQVGPDAHASMHVRHGGDDLGRLVLRRHVADVNEVDASGTPFLALAAMLASARGADLRIDAPVDPCAARNTASAATLLGAWFGWRIPAISTAEPVDPPGRAAAVGLFFSRGLDSMTTLTIERERIDVLLGMDWRDPPHATAGTAEIWRSTQRAAADADRPLIALSTNARTLLDPVVPWEISHGVVLAALAQLVSPTVGEALLSGTHHPDREEPHGSHPDLVAHWTSGRVAVTYAPGPGSRPAKAVAVAGEPLVERWLKVCWERPGDGNCGRCTKCLETMTSFAIAGGLDDVGRRFDARLTPEAVLAVAASGATTPANVLSLLDALDPADPLYAPWKLVYAQAVESDATKTR